MNSNNYFGVVYWLLVFIIFINVDTSASKTVKIIGGLNATEGEFPFIVSLQMKPSFGNVYHYCAGVIADRDLVITAAHCITGRDIAQIEVVAGAYNLTNSIEPTQQRSGISDVFFHSRFNPETLEYDAASLVLSKPFEFGPRVQPALIPEPPFYPSESVVNCTLVGWGSAQSSLSEDESSQLLQKLNMTVVPFAECQLIYQHIKPINRSTMICASHIGEHGFGGGPCKGDAGGPLVCKIPPQNETEVIGIVSWSMIPCADPSFPPVFTNSSIFHDDFLV